MIQEVIEKLHPILRSHLCTLEKASLDNSNEKNMSHSQIKVINFDKIPKEYAKKHNIPKLPTSNDALYISSDNKWFFIEFKNGSIDKAEFRKIYDSLLMLLELEIIENLDFSRENIYYILVYNSDKKAKIPETQSMRKNTGYLYGLAKTEKRLFDIRKFEKLLFKEAHTYTIELFKEKFEMPMEADEQKFSLSDSPA